MEQQVDSLVSPDMARIQKMDLVAESLLKLIESEQTTDAQKSRLFAQVMAWYKLRPTLVPSGEGGKLEEMSRGLKSASGKRSGSARSNGSKGAQGKTIRDIRQIIASFPKPGTNSASGREQGQGSADAGSADGDQEDSERAGIGGDSDGIRVRPNGDGDDPGNGNVVGHSH